MVPLPQLPGKTGRDPASFFEGALLPSTGAGRAVPTGRTAHILKGSTLDEGNKVSHRTSSPNAPFPRTEPPPTLKSPTDEVLDILASLPPSALSEGGISMDLRIACREAHRPVGGRLSLFLPNWMRISSDQWILDTVRGYKLDLMATPFQHHKSVTFLDGAKAQAMSQEVETLHRKRAIVPISESQEEFISPVFLVPKSDGSWRTVINLKALNRFVVAPHFKMESIRTVKNIIREGDWMAKLDLKDAYLTVHVHPRYQRFLQFKWNLQTWQFRVLPFGLNSAPHAFTKLLKPVVATLRSLGARVILYLDDMLILAEDKKEGRKYLATALELLVALGFIINVEKSMFNLTQSIDLLGFLLNSRTMTISLPREKLHAIQKAARKLRELQNVSVRQVACLLGMLVAAHPAILPAPLHYRNLERGKFVALNRNNSSNWRLHPEIFWSLEASLSPLTIDLFASRTNHQLPLYCSWRPDPGAVAIDALSIPWREHHAYVFPPFALIPQCLRKLEAERARAILVAPMWANQPWYPQLLKSLISRPILLPMTQEIIQGHPHPMVVEGHLPLAAWPVSGDHMLQKDFLTELSASSEAPGEDLLRQLTHQRGDYGQAGVRDGLSIPFLPL